MLGPPKPRRLDEPIAVSLEDLVPRRQLLPPPGGEARPGLRPRLGAGAAMPSGAGPVIDPVVFFKLQLVMFFEGIRSERKLIETASLNLAHRWYLGYALDEELPDHSSLTRIRQRLGRRHLPALLRAGRRSLPGGGAGLGPGALRRRHQGRGQRRPRFARPALLPRGQDPRRRPLRRRCPAADLTRLSRTAAGGRPACRGSCCACRRAAGDRGGRTGAGTAAGSCWRSGGWTRTGRRSAATSARPTSGSARPIPTPRRCAPATGRAWATTTITSSTAGKRAHHPGRPGHPGRRDGERAAARPALAGLLPAQAPARPGDRRHHLRHDREHRRRSRTPASGPSSRCPISTAARRSSARARSPTTPRATPTAARRGSRCRAARPSTPRKRCVYRADAATCNACPVKAECTASDHGRIVHRSFYEDYLDKVRGYHATEAYQKAMRKRQVWVEPLFAEAKDWHGLRRLPAPRPAEREHPGAADRGRPEPEALAGRDRLGTAPRPLREPRGPPEGATSGSQPSPGDCRSGRRSRHR